MLCVKRFTNKYGMVWHNKRKCQSLLTSGEPHNQGETFTFAKINEWQSTLKNNAIILISWFITWNKYLHISIRCFKMMILMVVQILYNIYICIFIVCMAQHPKKSFLSAAPGQSEAWWQSGILALENDVNVVGGGSEWSNVGFLKQSQKRRVTERNEIQTFSLFTFHSKCLP